MNRRQALKKLLLLTPTVLISSQWNQLLKLTDAAPVTLRIHIRTEEGLTVEELLKSTREYYDLEQLAALRFDYISSGRLELSETTMNPNHLVVNHKFRSEQDMNDYAQEGAARGIYRKSLPKAPGVKYEIELSRA